MVSGKIYEIKFGPEGKLACRIEKDNTPAYAYQRVQRKGEVCTPTELTILWVRAAAIMEKNFVAAPEISYADLYGYDLAAQSV